MGGSGLYLIQVRDRWQALVNIVGTFTFRTVWGILWLVKKLFITQEGLCCMDSVRPK
jgi:hypothetical protein